MSHAHHIPELDDLERLEGHTMTGAQYSYLTLRWSRLRDDRLEIEDRVTDLLRERQRRREAIHRAVVLVVTVAVCTGIALAALAVVRHILPTLSL